ncbi:hypothetical protein MN086_07120 [Sulfurovum sp. XGS-02]|uniref:hypothetical protein n=1 Tax=Sulfurovum sp. XGS-02 TaxID=2925411 RepID=UPI00204AF2DA|nr:hypothetical protein [Sulfurovum sp. XGS-02]UPT76823.1 hypothetical protein MN086_07120 [Sulfurovum sp. XGS-02]
MSAQKWIKIWMIMILTISFAVGLINYVIDPLGFNKKILIKNMNIVKEDNTLFTIKYKMPLLKKGGWDNLMLGTSRIGLMDTHVADRYLGGKTFTMSLPGSAMPLQWDSFLYAIKFNNIKNIIYGIDFMTFNKNLKFNDDYVQLKEEIQSFDSFYTYDIYFNIQTLIKSIRTIVNNNALHPRYHVYYSESGMRHFPNYKQKLKNGTFKLQNSINDHIKYYFDKNRGIYAKYEYSHEYMRMFKKIVDYCHKNDIKIYVYIPPMYAEHFYALKEAGLKQAFETFKRELAEITDFTDFTGVNSITTNKDNYWDSSHLRKEHTELVISKLLYPEDSVEHQDFGVQVTKENIEAHLKQQNDQYKYIDLKEILDSIYRH